MPSEKSPDRPNAEIPADEERVLREPREGGERKESADELLDLEPGLQECLGTGAVGQRKVVIVEVPVVAGGVLDVRLEGDEAPARVPKSKR